MTNAIRDIERMIEKDNKVMKELVSIKELINDKCKL
jgi:hypothetical protein